MKQPIDTSPDAERMLIEGYRRMSPAEKLRRVVDLNQAALQMARARIQARYGPDLSEEELRMRLAALWLGRELMIAAFGWDPEREGY
ncbi:MAG: hypothetical protein JXR96_02425 [Deltaproteobacteria bacterium]|nr:hypothetical protein [Deltaproteobacteria bacterium]